VLMDAQAPRLDVERAEYRALGPKLELKIELIDVAGPEGFVRAFLAARETHAQAMVLPQTPMMNFHRERLAALALQHRLPTVAGAGEGQFARSGGFMNYGASILANWRRSADYVHKILEGAQPADLPVERPARFELVINLKTAQALGLTVPPHLLVLADEVIR
jgi:putative ABC transport system substrate-binding protein